ncbi:MAG: radical SAM protein [Clostridia bacterium]|nr:radical SAM protein [Clostridia bacterium]
MGESLLDKLKSLPEEERHSWLDSFLVTSHRRENMLQHIHMELTPCCTLSCKMCFVHSHKDTGIDLTKQLKTKEWCSLIDQAANMGVSGLTFTGGEAMMREDYLQIYRHAYEQGFKIFIISNGTLIDEVMVRFLQECPPERINLTLYGFSEKTYEENCGNGKAFLRVLHAIELIEKANLPLEIQTTITRDMFEDFPQIFDFAKEHHHKFKFDYILHPSDICDLDKIMQLSVSDEAMDRMCQRVYGVSLFENVDASAIKPPEKTVKTGMLCGAGRNVCQIDWQGQMQLCTVCSFVSLRPLERGLERCWKDLTEYAKTIPQIEECQMCEYRFSCKQCVGLHYADMHEFGRISPRLCRKRKQM